MQFETIGFFRSIVTYDGKIYIFAKESIHEISSDGLDSKKLYGKLEKDSI